MTSMHVQYLHQPREVSLETLALCNARCIFCPYPTLTRKGVEMSTGLISRCINEMSTWSRPFFFSPFKVNEPFLDKRLQWICEEFERQCHAGRLRLFTNGSVLTPKNMQWMKTLMRVEHVWISLNSHCENEYEAIMGLRFDHTTRCMDELHAQMVTLSPFPHPVVVSKVAEDDATKNLAFYRYCVNRWPMFRCQIIKRDGWLGYIDPSNSTVPDLPCVRWYELSVLATGVVALCCMDGTGEFSIGDINQKSLLDVYNSPYWLSRRVTTISRRHFDPCARCTY